MVKLVPKPRGSVRGKHIYTGGKLHKSTFNRDLQGVPVSYLKKLIIGDPAIKIIKDHTILARITIPPRATGLIVNIIINRKGKWGISSWK